MAVRLEITTEGLERLALLEDLPEHSESQFAEVTILRSLEDDVTAPGDGFIERVLPDSLQAEGSAALSKLLRNRHVSLQQTFRSNPRDPLLRKAEERKEEIRQEPKEPKQMSSMDFILGPDPNAPKDTHEEEEEEPVGLAGEHFVDDLQGIDLRSGL